MEIRLVSLSAPLVFRESQGPGGIVCTRVYVTDNNIALRIIRKIRNKRITLRWFRQNYSSHPLQAVYSLIERVRFYEISEKNIIWKHKIPENLFIEILNRASEEKKVYDNVYPSK